MSRLARLPLAVAAISLMVACQGDRAVTPNIASPSFALDDGTRLGGNPDFFFLPPIVRNPSGDVNFDAGAFNPDLLPVVNVCELSGNPSLGPVTCGAIVFGPVTAHASVADEHYAVNWHTDESNSGRGLNLNGFYRIQVFVSEGGTRLGFADVDPVNSLKELKNVQSGDVFGLVDGRTLPIKFRIEEGALCQGNDTCSSETIVLANGGSVVLEETGDRVDIPAQNSGRTITVTLQLCDGIDVDLRKFGNCLTVTSDPPLGENFRFDPPASVSMCSVLTDPDVVSQLAALIEEQEDLVTMHRQDDGDIYALPHGGQFCTPQINRGPSNPLQQLVRALRELFTPRPLHAATTVLDVGPSGETDGFSDFQLALPAQMFPADGTDEISGPVGGEASPVPAVVMMDAGDPPEPVAGALVTFRVTGGDGNFGLDESEGPITEVQVLSDATGRAAVPRWVLGGEGTNTVTASGRGFAEPDDNGPFMPDISLPTVCENENPCQEIVQLPDPLDDREVTFTATFVQPDLVISSGAPRVTPSVVTPGGIVRLSAGTVRNQGAGSVPTGGVVNIAYLLSTDATITRTDAFLGSSFITDAGMTPGQEIAGPATVFTIPAATAPGDYWIGILADQDNAVDESIETNNFVSTPLTVVAATIFEATFTNDAADAAPGTPEIGTWTSTGTAAGTVLVRAAVGDLTQKPVELDQVIGLTGGVHLLGSVAGTAPASGVYAARFRMLWHTEASGGVFVLRDTGALVLCALGVGPLPILRLNDAILDGVSWTPDVAQSYEITVDLDQNVCSLKVNDVAVAGAQGVPFFQSAAANLQSVEISHGGTFAQTSAWDDLRVVRVP